MKRAVAGTVVAAFWVSAGLGVEAQAAKTYRTRLGVVPVAAATPTVTGVGSVTATLAGTKLTIAGTFEGLASPATLARLLKSAKPGVRGTPLFDLTVSKGTSGTISGTFDLTPAQVQELVASRYYVQLHSEKAPDGNLWGWLMAQENRR